MLIQNEQNVCLYARPVRNREARTLKKNKLEETKTGSTGPSLRQ